MIFEGSEKKLEVVVKPGTPSLREWPRETWERIVAAAKAQIISKISSNELDAYLLSESSLFVWDERFTIITCGTTTLGDAAIETFKKLTSAEIACVIYERKNEYFPQLQTSDFYDDVKKIHATIPGRAFRLGNADEHHLFMFHSERPYKPEKTDRTLEILMYDLQGAAKDIFNTDNATVAQIREATGVHQILKDYQVDDFAFDPIGYSLNAVKGQNYYTIHVTPQEESPYVSFETNEVEAGKAHKVLAAVLEVFRPRSFDAVLFDCDGKEEKLDLPSYQRRSEVHHKFECGYCIQYAHFSQSQTVHVNALEIEI
jgi:S-adenosylmethionine decarboxylase